MAFCLSGNPGFSDARRRSPVGKTRKEIIHVRLSVFVGVCGLMLAGCAGRPADYPETAPVRGVVTLDGKPLTGASVNFVPAAGRSSAGMTDDDGRYELSYTGRIKGAMLGSHRVMLSKRVPDSAYEMSPQEKEMLANGDYFLPLVEMLPERYRGSESELSAEVESGRNVIDFKLTSEPSSRQP